MVCDPWLACLRAHTSSLCLHEPAGSNTAFNVRIIVTGVGTSLAVTNKPFIRPRDFTILACGNAYGNSDSTFFVNLALTSSGPCMVSTQPNAHNMFIVKGSFETQASTAPTGTHGAENQYYRLLLGTAMGDHSVLAVSGLVWGEAAGRCCAGDCVV